MGLYSGERARDGLIYRGFMIGRENTSIYNLFNLLLFFPVATNGENNFIR